MTGCDCKAVHHHPGNKGMIIESELSRLRQHQTHTRLLQTDI